MSPRQHFTLRIDPATLGQLERQAELREEPKTNYASRLLEEAVRAAQHPGIVFRDGAAGRRASIVGRRLDVWQVMETLRDTDGDVAETARYHQLTAGLVEAARGYYSDHREEIDALIADNAALAEAEAQRRSALPG